MNYLLRLSSYPSTAGCGPGLNFFHDTQDTAGISGIKYGLEFIVVRDYIKSPDSYLNFLRM